MGIGIPVGIFIIFVVIALIIQINSIAIYDNFSKREDFRFTSYSPPLINFQNNNPLNLEQLNPIVFAQIQIIQNSSLVECKVSTLGGQKPCSETSIDLGKIKSGESKDMTFYINGNGNDFTIQATPYLDFFKKIQLPSRIWECHNTEGDLYWCE